MSDSANPNPAWPSVGLYENGQSVTADTLNEPITRLIQRTEYLLGRLRQLDGTKVVVSGASLDGDLTAGQPVYRDPAASGGASYRAAAARAESDAWFYAAQEALAVGVVGPGGSVVLFGLVDFAQAKVDVPVASVIADRNPESGRHYLSASAGRLTRFPAGPVIYVCDVRLSADRTKVDSMLVCPQYRDTGESHVHRSFVLDGLPVGGFACPEAGHYEATGILDDSVSACPSSLPDGVSLLPCGTWCTDREETYTVSFSAAGGLSSMTMSWSGEGGGQAGVAVTGLSASSPVSDPVQVGTLGLYVRVRVRGTFSSSYVTGKTWTVSMPDAGKRWDNAVGESGFVGYRLNLAMHPEMAEYVMDMRLPLPKNGSSLSVDGVELPGPAFGASRMRWEILSADSPSEGGPWLVWYGGSVLGKSSTAPFVYETGDSGPVVTGRNLLFCANRMRVGPTGFVTSLQAAPGSPLKVTSAQTSAPASQGALQLDLSLAFSTVRSGVAGSEVVKRISGSSFETGPVVERIVAGPGIDANRASGIVTLSASNAVYAGDFETIALKNAKQDVTGGVFPYTKLLGWPVGSSGQTQSGFTAKFRVPDHIPYGEYRVVVSASVFGENDVGETSSGEKAFFRMGGYCLADYSCSTSPNPMPEIPEDGRVVGDAPVIPVTFPGGYGRFSPVLVHGFGDLSGDVRSPRRQYVSALLLQRTDDRGVQAPLLVRPGYFVGLDIARCGSDDASATPYVSEIGFLSLRWNLVYVGEVQ